jgi:hypothetical protein
MDMKTIICLLLYSTTVLSQDRQQARLVNDALPYIINWSATKDWKLYYIHSKRGYAFPIDTLINFKSVSLNQDSMKTFLHTVTEIPRETPPSWMGYYVASCRLPDGKLVKIEISQYGRFFFEEREKRYYELTEKVESDWLSYLTVKWRVLEGVSE